MSCQPALVGDVEGQDVLQVADGETGGATSVEAGVVEQDARNLLDRCARHPYVTRLQAAGELQPSAVMGEQSVPPFLGLLQQLWHRPVRYG
ncbi:hypothetical protein [Streptomyces echinatus]|uniref:hypothetical protein n=1 Tax=Streptomyces echinatus TaxID=67293 RepID=UPI0037975B88